MDTREDNPGTAFARRQKLRILLERDFKQYDQLPLSEIRSLANALQEELSDTENEIDRYESLRKNTIESFDEFLSDARIFSSFTGSELVGKLTSLSIQDACTRLSAIQSQVSVLRRSVSTVVELSQRLGRMPDLVRIDTPDIENFASALEAQCDGLQDEIDVLAARDQQASSMLQSLIDAAPFDRADFIALMSDKDIDCLIDSTLGSRIDKKSADNTVVAIQEDWHLAGLLLGYLVSRTTANAGATVFRWAERAQGDRLKLYELFAYLEFIHLQKLVEAHSDYEETVFEFTLAAARISGDIKQLAWLRPLVPFSASQRQNPTGMELLHHLVSFAEESPPQFTLEQLRESAIENKTVNVSPTPLLEIINHAASAGGGPLFHALRESARNIYLFQLRRNVAAGKWRIAIKQWREFGSLDSMVEKCVAPLSRHDRRHLETRHRDATRRYLETFEQQLESAAACQSKQSDVPADVIKTLESLREATLPDAFSRRVKELMFGALSDTGVQWPPPDFCRRVSFGSLSENSLETITGSMLNSWLQESAGKPVKLECLIADQLAFILDVESRVTTTETIAAYTVKGEFLAAEKAVGSDEDLKEFFDELIKEKKQELACGILDEARAASKNDDDIRFAVEAYDDAILTNNFEDAGEIVATLETLVERHRLLDNPEHARMVKFVEQLDIWPIPTSVEELDIQIGNAKIGAAERRMHIKLLEDSIEEFPATLRAPLENLCTRIDMPRHWPATAEESFDVAGWIEYFRDFIIKKSEARRQQFASKLASWFIAELEKCVCSGDGPNFTDMERIKNGREREFWEENEILRFIQPTLETLQEIATAETEASRDASAELPSKSEVQPDTQSIGPKPKSDSNNSDVAALHELLDAIRETVDELRRQNVGQTRRSCSDAEIKRLCATERWDEVVRKICHHEDFLDLPTSGLAEQECVLVIADASSRLISGTCNPSLLSNACVAAAWLSVHQGYYISDRMLQELAAGFTMAILNSGRPLGGHRQELSAKLVKTLADSPRGEKATRRIDEVIGKLRQIEDAKDESLRGDVFLICSVWEEFRGMQKAASPRADLILSLYQLDRIDLLRVLAKKYASGLYVPIIQCLEAFNQAASNPDALDEAAQLAMIVHEQSSREKKIAPWTKVISVLHSSRREDSEGDPFSVKVESIIANNQSLVINASLVPSRNDWPLALNLRVFSGENEEMVHSQDLLGGKALVRPRQVCVRIPIENTSIRDGFVRLPYEVTGQSNQVDEILVRGSWSWKEEKPVELFSPRDLRHHWPGADGKDVKSRELHHGRHDAILKIETALAGEDGYQRSLLIIGQRRIGKTSLLNQVVNSYPPRPGACCSLFANVSALDTEQRHLSCALFEKIIHQLEFAPGGKNEKLLKEFTSGTQPLRRVMRDIDPTQSLAGALEGMAKTLSNITHGKITRIAFCLDEFQSIFGWKKQDELKSLMWDLRQAVQSSKCVSLLMAGSGLTRRLTDSYDEALFGSIDTIELTPFSMDGEREAVYDTFLPASVRAMLEKEESVDSLVKAAHGLTGGHPWYLAILGSAMGAVFGKTAVTPSMLSVVVEELVHGNVASGGMKFRASNFYGHLFESLNVLGPRETAIAQLVLLQIARNTTTDWRDYSEARLLRNESLVSLCDRQELSGALKTLEREQVIAKDRKNAGRVYRIRVPIVAESLKEDSDEIEDEALNLLRS